MPLFAPSASQEVHAIGLSANQTARLAVGNHIEFDGIDSDGGTLVSLATGVGQANGLITIEPGRYKLTITVRIAGSASSGVWWRLLFADDSDALDALGVAFRLSTPMVSNAANVAAQPVGVGVFEFATAQTVKMAVDSIDAGSINSLAYQVTRLLVEEI